MTLEPEEEEEFSEEENSCGQRAPMRKPATLVQYWIDTGNIPYNIYFDKKELSESGSSLSEETSSPSSTLSSKVNESDKHEHENNTSSSSVDTAAYILSNANVTKKANTTAIIEGVKLNGIKSSEDNCIKDAKIVCNDRTKCVETIASDHVIHNENNNNVSHNTFYSTSMENMASETNGQLSTNTVKFDVTSQNSPCDLIDKINMPSDCQNNSDVHNINNIVPIFQQFNKGTKRLSIDDKNNDALNEKETLRKYHSEEQVPTNISQKTVRTNTSLPLHRKKLYTGRNSPVDLIFAERQNIDLKLSQSSNIGLSSHPALDSDNLSSEKSSVYKVKDVKKNKSKFIKDNDITQTKSHNAHNNSAEYCSPDLNPVVLLEQITFSKENRSKFVKDNDITQIKSHSAHNNSVSRSQRHSCELGKVDFLSIDSDESTIVFCKCNNNMFLDSSSVDEVSCSSFHLKLSTEECNSSTVSTEKKDKKDVKLREVKVVLKRLPADMLLKRSSNTTNMSLLTSEDESAQGTSINNRKKPKHTIRRLNAKKKKTSVRTIRKFNNYSSKLRAKSKKNVNAINVDIAEHDNQVSDKTKSNSIPRYEDHDSQESQGIRENFPVLDLSSDDDDLVRLLQSSKKRLKTSTDDKTNSAHIAEKNLYDEAKLVNTNKDKYDFRNNVSAIIYSSKQGKLRKIDGSIKEKNQRHTVKSSDSNVASNNSFQTYRHKKFSLFPRRNDDNDSTTVELNRLQRSCLFSNSKNISNNSKGHLNKAIKENGIKNQKNTITLFQTKTFYIYSSDSDRSDNESLM